MDHEKYKLFPVDLPGSQWETFQAEGFTKPACGVIYRLERPKFLTSRRSDPMTPRWNRPNGMPLGGIDTGCIDLELNGTLGYMTIFNSHVPRRGPLDLPLLGISNGKNTWILADLDRYHSSIMGNETIFYFAPEKRSDGDRKKWSAKEYFQQADWQVRGVDEIHYWGHYPVADLEFELSEMAAEPRPGSTPYKGGYKSPAPLSVGLRAWSPFLPGDLDNSLIPGTFFEVYIRNVSDSPQAGSVAFSFPGPSLEEADEPLGFPHMNYQGKFSGVHVTNGKDISYALGVVDRTVRTGGELGTNGKAWSQISDNLPYVLEGQPGASAAVDYALLPGEQNVFHFLLTWYSPRWQGGGTLTSGGNTYTHMYAAQFQNALDVARAMADRHDDLLRHLLAWQEVVYTEESLPVWLREALVNILHLITEDGMWAQAGPTIGEWCRAEDGLFGMNECPRDCPQMECIPCTFYGNIPLVYFFPKLAVSNLRGFRAYQNSDGSIPFNFSRPPTIELAHDFSESYEVSTNGPCYVDLVDRYWQASKDDTFLQEFYPSVKANVIFTMNLNKGNNGVISTPTGNINRGEGYVRPLPPGNGIKFGGEHNGVFGMSSHLGGLHLAQLRIAERMAEKSGDQDFAQQCREWIDQGSDSLESKLWANDYYLNYWEPETGKKSDWIYAYQLVGEWIANFHGLPGVFRKERVKRSLDTIARRNIPLTKFGAAMFARPESGTVDRSFDAGYGAYSMFPSETTILASTFLYAGEIETGMELARRHWENIICNQGHTWQQPNLLRGDADTGEAAFGSDYYQNLILWILPAAITGDDLCGSIKPGGLVDRICKTACGRAI